MTAIKGEQTKGASVFFPWVTTVPAWLTMVAIGAAMPLVYWLGIALPYPLRFGLAHPRGTWVAPGEGSLPAMAAQIGAYLVATLLYVVALRMLPRTTARHTQWAQAGWIVLVWALCSFTLLFAAPNGESHDIYDYVFRGRMLDRQAASPLVVTPDAFPKEPFYRYVAWKRNVDTYGPLWEYSSGGVSRSVRLWLERAGSFSENLPTCPKTAASCRMLAAYLTGYRLLAIVLAGLSGLLIYGIVRSAQPDAAPLALVVWLWNPLLLIATALGAHNDAIMLLLLFLAYWFWQRERWLAGWLAIGLAAHVKLTILLLVPALGLWLVRRVGWRRAFGVSTLAAVITLAVSWALYEPLGGWATLPRMLHERQLFVAHSLAQILYFLLYKVSAWPYTIVRTMMVQWPTWLFLAAAALLLLRAFVNAKPSQPDAAAQGQLYRTCTLLTLLYLLVGSFWFQPWYLVWVLAPAVLWIDGGFPRQGLPWVCFGALCSNVVYDHLTQLPPAAEPDAHGYRLVVTVLVVMTIWLPLFAAQGLSAWRRWAGVHSLGYDQSVFRDYRGTP